jgi:predicted acyltransferase
MSTFSQQQAGTGRLLSLDALRGFDMLWIIGGDGLFHALAGYSNAGFFHWASNQLEHVEWNGFVFYDMIFPLFLFIAGVSLPFSIAKRKAQGDSQRSIYWHLLKRALILVAFGIIYNGFFQFDWENTRYASVLGRIGLAWFFGALIFMRFSLKWQIVWFWAILIVYWLAMVLIPVPVYGAGNLTMEGSLAGYIDRMLLPGKLYRTIHDPEGILSTLPSVATALLGIMTGQWLRMKHEKLNPLRKALLMGCTGIIFLGLGQLWNLWFPINKNLWTSSFVLYAGGWSLLLLSLFYLVIDVWSFRKWAFPFVVIGLNSITIYMCQAGIIDFSGMRDFFFGGAIGYCSVSVQPVLQAAGYILMVWLFLYLLYRYKIFLKV